MDISFVILTWNSEAYLEKCLGSLLSALKPTEYTCEIFIIDNGSQDNTVALLKNYEEEYDFLKVIYLEENIGTTKSRNLALQQAQGAYICVLDSDVEIRSDIFEGLIEILEKNDNVGMVVPKIYYPSGKWQKSIDQFPTILHKLKRFIWLRDIEDKEGAKEGFNEEQRTVDYAISAFWLFKKEVLDKVGLLDEKFFYAPEDVDYCLRIWQSGYQIRYLPQVSVVHHTQEISRGVKMNRAKWEHVKGLLYYFFKHGYIFRKQNFKTKIQNKSVLILAYHFPPSTGSGALRPLYFANHLVEKGYSVHVITCDEKYYLPAEKYDEKNLSLIHQQVRVTKCKSFHLRDSLIAIKQRLSANSPSPSSDAKGGSSLSGKKGWYQTLKDFITDLLATPDPQIGWLPACVRQTIKAINSDRPDYIIATGGPWSGLLAGSIVKRVKRVPLILDFRDPWVANPRFEERGSLFKKIDTWLEKRVVHNADLVIANTEEACSDFKTRYADIPSHRFVSLPNGFESYLEQIMPINDEPFTIVHAGALYFSRDPLPLITAIADLILSGDISAGEISLKLVGGMEKGGQEIEQLLSNPKVTSAIQIIPRVPYADAQRFMQQADLLLLLQPDFPLQIPRKLYEYMAVRKPILCIAETGSATANIVKKNQLGIVCNNAREEIKEAIHSSYLKWKKGEIKTTSLESTDQFLNLNLTNNLLANIERTLYPHNFNRDKKCP